jgi:hypothetical protein
MKKLLSLLIIYFVFFNSLIFSQTTKKKINKILYNEFGNCNVNQFVKNKKNGLWVFYSIKNKIFYIGNENDSSKNRRELIQLVITKTGYYYNNIKDSTWRIYSKHGQLSYSEINYGDLLYEVQLKSNKIEGFLVTYNSLNKIQSIIEFHNNIPSGKFECFNEDGSLKYSGFIMPFSNKITATEFNKTKIINIDLNFDTFMSEWTNMDEIYNRLFLEE